jgi:hypothetical protein
LGNKSAAEFAGAVLLTVPYVIYRSFSPCVAPPTTVQGVLGSMGDFNKTMSPVVLYQMGGYRRAAAAASAAPAAAASAVSAAASAAASAGHSSFVGGRR